MVEIAGVLRSHIEVSQTSAMSAFSSSAFSVRNGIMLGLADSSSPSKSTVRLTGSRPVSAIQARAASTKVISWPLSSSEPRPTIRFSPFTSTIAGSKGSRSQSADRIDRLHVVMAVEEHVRRALPGPAIMPDHHRMADRLAHASKGCRSRSACVRSARPLRRQSCLKCGSAEIDLMRISAKSRSQAGVQVVVDALQNGMEHFGPILRGGEIVTAF